jgi:hypothetical protein
LTVTVSRTTRRAGGRAAVSGLELEHATLKIAAIGTTAWKRTYMASSEVERQPTDRGVVGPTLIDEAEEET